ncbi:MAG TPA: cyanophycinase [Bacteroidales bacterium]|nr:cyanophycinase [Bacteroidales bacterium]
MKHHNLIALLLCLAMPAISLASLPKGKLYIIGGGKRPMTMAAEMASLAALDRPGHYAVVLPMASSEPDSAFHYFKKDFVELGFDRVFNFNFSSAAEMPMQRIDSVKKASLIFISGGDQNRFMEIVANTPLHKAILEAYQQGAVVGGTSAGAAVQSKKMITGRQLRHLNDESGYRTIESGNIELAEGLGLIEDAIIDQHFIRRQRMNRLIAVALEHPGQLLIGIDESTALVVEGNRARVSGLSQIIVLKNTAKNHNKKDNLIGGQNLQLSIYLPGEEFDLK